jgi:hypothetical protein
MANATLRVSFGVLSRVGVLLAEVSAEVGLDPTRFLGESSIQQQ